MSRKLTCPECSALSRVERGGHASTRIGNRRADCKTCNRFAAACRREVDRTLREITPEEEMTVIRESVGAIVYAAMFPSAVRPAKPSDNATPPGSTDKRDRSTVGRSGTL